ncbi:WAP four-disulfide core domain protein 1 isoform X2 [Vulpes lagopus]|uniref:WAP four-disulfide core domain protein 1 isoform X2 n=1 Tax=Vulpes lagopus TaxID=494514 RepID=UPI001BCA2B0E|nr:WAP four-disulfide core domain protein 1 isoform X2 [Vulpes lagopus]
MIRGTRLSRAKRPADCAHFCSLLVGPPQPEGPSSLNMWEEMPFSSRRMGSGRRKVIWALCFLLLLLEAGSAKNLWKRALHPRLAEKPRAEEAAGPRQPRADRCPPPPRSLPPGACQAARCQADSECPRHRRCCYNGCAYACLEAVPPPPVLDWLVQPKPRWLGGNGWLLDGPEEVLQDGRFLRHKFYKEYPEGDSKNVAEPGKGPQRHFQ